MWTNIWSVLNDKMAAELVSAFNNPWNIAAAWAASATFELYADTYMIDSDSTFAFCAMILYQSIVKMLFTVTIWVILSDL